MNRRARRGQVARTRGANKAEARHHCALDKSAEAAGVAPPVALSLEDFHAVHRALGEPRCPRCPRCDQKKGVTVPRAVALAIWRQTLERRAVAEIQGLDKIIADRPDVTREPATVHPADRAHAYIEAGLEPFACIEGCE